MFIASKTPPRQPDKRVDPPIPMKAVDVKTARAWWKKQVEPKRRYPSSKDLRVLHACWDSSCSDKMDWVTSRKRIYAPEYFELMKDHPSVIALHDYVASEKDVVVYFTCSKENSSVFPHSYHSLFSWQNRYNKHHFYLYK